MNNDLLTLSKVELSGKSTDELLVELAKCVEVTAMQIQHMANIVRELEQRGENLDNIRLGILTYLRLIAYGQMLPEVLATYQGSPALLKRISTLPLPDQRLLLDHPEVIVVSPDDPVDHRRVPITSLGRKEIWQVFGDGKIRDAGQQRSYLRDHVPRKMTRKTEESGIQLDAKRGGIVVNGQFISSKQMLLYLTQLKD